MRRVGWMEKRGRRGTKAEEGWSVSDALVGCWIKTVDWEKINAPINLKKTKLMDRGERERNVVQRSFFSIFVSL